MYPEDEQECVNNLWIISLVLGISNITVVGSSNPVVRNQVTSHQQQNYLSSVIPDWSELDPWRNLEVPVVH